MKCWLCERSGFAPGEIAIDFFGDPECIYCTSKITMTVKLMDKPKMIRLIAAIEKLPYVDGVKRIGIQLESEEEMKNER